jgi:hypothetical protein
MAKKTEAELLQEADRQAQDALTQLGTPEQTYVGGALEFEQEQDEAEAIQLERALDRESDASDRARLLRLEECMADQAKLLMDLMQEFRSLRIHTTGTIIPATEADLPVRSRALSDEELNQLVTITIFADPDPKQNRPVEVTVNGQKWRIERGAPVRVPRFVVEVLEHATIDTWEYPVEGGRYVAQKTDLTPMTTSPPVHRKYPRFNFAYA